MNTEIVTMILDVVVGVILVILAKVVIPKIKNSVSSDTLDTVTCWVNEAVNAAEQMMKSSTGAEKKEYVINFVDQVFQENNINISAEQLDVLVEAAVKKMNDESKKTEEKKS